MIIDIIIVEGLMRRAGCGGVGVESGQRTVEETRTGNAGGLKAKGQSVIG